MSKSQVEPNSDKSRLKALANTVKDRYIKGDRFSGVLAVYLPGVQDTDVKQFLDGIKTDPSQGNITDYVGTPDQDFVHEGGQEIESTEIELFADKELTDPESKKNYFYQQLLVSCLEDDEFARSDEFSFTDLGLDGFNDEHLDVNASTDDTDKNPAALYLLIKFQDLKNRNEEIFGEMTYNQFKAVSKEAFENISDQLAFLTAEEMDEEKLALFSAAAENLQDRRSVTSEQTTGSVDSRLTEEHLADLRDVATILRRSHPQNDNSSVRSDEMRSVTSGREDEGVDFEDNVSEMSEQDNQALPMQWLRDSDLESVSSEQETLPLPRPPFGKSYKKSRDDESVSSEEPFGRESSNPTPQYRRSRAVQTNASQEPLGSSVNIAGIVTSINGQLKLILDKIEKGEPVGVIAQSLTAMNSYLADIGKKLPAEGEFASLQDSVRKISEDIARIAKAPPVVAKGKDGAPGIPGAPADLTPIKEEIKQLSEEVKKNEKALKAELSKAGKEAEDLARKRFSKLNKGQDDLLGSHEVLGERIGELDEHVNDLGGRLDSMATVFSDTRDDIANIGKKHGEQLDTLASTVADIKANIGVKPSIRRTIDQKHLDTYGYNKDSDGNEFLIPEIKGQITANHMTGIEQHESSGIPVFVYEDMDAFSQDVERAAMKPWPEGDKDKVVSSIARIEGKYCSVTATSRGVSKTFLDENQFEELERQAQKRYDSVILAHAKREDLEKVISSLEEEREAHIAASRKDELGNDLEDEEYLEQARSVHLVIEYLREDVLTPLTNALDPTKKISAVDRDRAIKKFNQWDCQEDLGFNQDLEFEDRLCADKLQVRRKADAIKRGIQDLGVSDEIGNDYLEEIIGFLHDVALQPLYDALNPDTKMSEAERNQAIDNFRGDWENDRYLDDHLNSVDVQVRVKAKALERVAVDFADNGWGEGAGYLQEKIKLLKDALDPDKEMSEEDRDEAINWDPSVDEFFAENHDDKEELIVRCIDAITNVQNFAKEEDEVARSNQQKRDTLLNLVLDDDIADYLWENFLSPFLDAMNPDIEMPQEDRDAAIQAFYEWTPDEDENIKDNEEVIEAYNAEFPNHEPRRTGETLSAIYETLNASIEKFAKNSIHPVDMQHYAGQMQSSVSRFDDELTEDERLEKLTQANIKAEKADKSGHNIKNSARRFASNQLSRDLVEDVKQAVKISEINDLDSSEVDHIVDHMVSKMHGAEASVTGHNKNRRNESAQKAKEILTAPMPHTPKNGISFFRPRDSNTVTIAFNYNNVKDNKLDGDSLAYFHIPGTNEMYGRAQICKDPTKPMAVMKNGKEVLEYHKFGDVVIDPDTIFHRNAAGKYDHFGTTGALWNDMESTFGEKGKNAITLYKSLGVKAISQINRAGKGEEPDVERKVAVMCEGQAFAYNGERQEKNVHNSKEVRLYGGDMRAKGREEKALGKKKNAVDEDGNDIEFEVGKAEEKFAKVGKVTIGNGTATEDLPLFTKISTDASGTITHDAVPYVSKLQVTLGEDIIQDLLCRQFCEKKGIVIEKMSETSKKLISIDEMGEEYPHIAQRDLDALKEESLRITNEFKSRPEHQKDNIVIADIKYPVYGTKKGDRSINVNCEPREFKDDRGDVMELAVAESKNTKLVITVVDPKTGEKKPVVSVHDEFEGMGHRKQGNSEKVKATVQDVVNLGTVPESDNFSHVNRARSPKNRGGRGA